MTKPRTNACRILFPFFPLYWACIQRQTDTKSKSHLVGCVRYIFIGGGFTGGVGRKHQPHLNARLKTLPLPALKASSPPWSQSHVGLMGDGDNAKMGNIGRNGHGGWRSETLPQHGAGTTASQCTVIIYKNDGATTQKSRKNPDALGT